VRRDPPRAALVFAILAVTAATTATAVPALATAERGAAPRGATAGDPRGDDAAASASPELLAAMGRDLNLTATQARERVRAEGAAARSVPSIREFAGSAYGGAWFDSSTQRLVVGLTETASRDDALVSAVRANGAEIKPVRHSMTALEETKSRMDGLARTTSPPALTGWYIDPRTNSVVVDVDSRSWTPAAAEFLDRAAGGVTPVRMAVTATNARPLADVVGGNGFDFPVGGRRGSCSVGFSAVGAAGTRHFVTAGHCTESDGGVVTMGGRPIGRISESTFGTAGDFGLVNVTDANSRLTPLVNRYDGRAITVTGARDAPIGASVCRSGVTSGFHCGVVVARNQTVNYGGGDVVAGLTRTTACAEPGDSGGPYLSGSQAQGLTSGGSGDCTTGGITFFQPVNEALRSLNLRLVTG